MIGGAVMTSLMLPLSGDLFELPAEAIVDNLLICAAVHESGCGTILPLNAGKHHDAYKPISIGLFVTQSSPLAQPPQPCVVDTPRGGFDTDQ
jgi:hypothetical protein